MVAKEVVKDRRNRLVIPQKETSLFEIVELVDSHFSEIPIAVRYERVIIEGPSGAEPAGFLFIGLRPARSFSTPRTCSLAPYYCVQQTLESVRTKTRYDLKKMGLMIPYEHPNNLTIHDFAA